MAQWSRADRTLYAKLVYYGPAFGGKTTNLEALHRITDPDNKAQLLSVKTVNDRTLFFDLLPFDLGEILGYQVAMKVYTVPGQVRYDTTRQVVLSGADAIVFVADSKRERREQNLWSYQNLRMNMRSKRLDPKRVPVLVQFNKQDLPDAAAPAEIARWLGIPVQGTYPAVAVQGQGVLETFLGAARAMLEKIVAAADERTRRQIDDVQLSEQIDRAFAPYRARLAQGPAEPSQGEALPRPAKNAIVMDSDNLIERAVQTGVELGERLTQESARATRLENEAEAFRRLSESLKGVAATFDRHRVIDAALDSTQEVLESPVASLVRYAEDGSPEIVRCSGATGDPLNGFADGRELLSRVGRLTGACVIDDLTEECNGSSEVGRLAGLRGAAAVPVEGDEQTRLLVYAAAPDGSFGESDIRFLSTVAGHLAVGLEKVRLHEEIANHRDQLENTVRDRTRELRQAYDGLRSMEAMKDRFLGNLSHEMKTPLTAILSAAVVLRDYDSGAAQRREMSDAIVTSAELLQRHLEDLFRVVRMDAEEQSLAIADVAPERLVEEAIALSGRAGIQFKLDDAPSLTQCDSAMITRALANLVDNAVKFSPVSSVSRIIVDRTELEGGTDGVVFRVLDRGPGVPEEDRERIFAPFEQGGDDLTEKPSGIGVGLYEARSIARSHGGDLDYLPRKDGGSEFRLTVPLVPTACEAVLEAARA